MLQRKIRGTLKSAEPPWDCALSGARFWKMANPNLGVASEERSAVALRASGLGVQSRHMADWIKDESIRV
ncbi:hypothetical protein EYE35_20845 [Cereibacter sphaeroides]|nr:hypothetical protein EYE35_20845 [Cereibacter sphaeroides]